MKHSCIKIFLLKQALLSRLLEKNHSERAITNTDVYKQHLMISFKFRRLDSRQARESSRFHFNGKCSSREGFSFSRVRLPFPFRSFFTENIFSSNNTNEATYDAEASRLERFLSKKTRSPLSHPVLAVLALFNERLRRPFRILRRTRHNRDLTLALT